MTRIALFLAVVALAGPRVAFASVNLSWHGCTVIEQDTEPYSPTDHVLTVSLDGVEADVNGVDVTIGVYDFCNAGGQFIPKAWQFQPGGCREGLLSIARPASVDGCPGLAPGPGGIALEQVSIGTVDRYIGGDATVHVPALLIRIQTAFASRHLDANTRYIIARITIPMAGTTPGVDPTGEACGCGITPRALSFVSGHLDGADVPPLFPLFDAYWVEQVNCAVAPKGPPALDGEPDPPSCLVTPAVAPSWGALKAQYR